MVNHTSTRNCVPHASGFKKSGTFHEVLQMTLNIVLFIIHVTLEGELIINMIFIHISLFTIDLEVFRNRRNFDNLCHFIPIIFGSSLARTVFRNHHTRLDNCFASVCPLIPIIAHQESAVGVHVRAG